MARNSMVEQALSYGATHILWIYSDNVPPVDVIKRFLDHDKDIVGAVYLKRVPPYELLGVPTGPVDFAAGGLVPYWLLPGGCVMVSAKVYRTVPKPWYFDTIRREGSPLEAFLSLLMDHYRIAPPDDLLESLKKDAPLLEWLAAEDEVNTTRFNSVVNTGEDYSFCFKARRYGFEAWCDLDVSFGTAHLGEQQVRMAKPEKQVDVSP
jgi:hypothetical protein